MQYEITRVSIIDLPSKAGPSNEKVKNELTAKVNYNNMLFNTPYHHASNLIDYSGREVFKKTPEEKLELKKAKKEYKNSIQC